MFTEDYFHCYLCQERKPIDDVAIEARHEYAELVCWKCWERAFPDYQPQEDYDDN